MSEAGIEKYKYPAEAVVCHTGCPLIVPFTNTPSQHDTGVSCVPLRTGGDDEPDEEPDEPDDEDDAPDDEDDAPDEPDEPDEEDDEPDDEPDGLDEDEEPLFELLSAEDEPLPPHAASAAHRASSSSLTGLALWRQRLLAAV